MSESRVSTINKKNQVKQKNGRFEGASFELSDPSYTECTSPRNEQCTRRNYESQTSERLSTYDLISGVRYVWDCAQRPLSVLLSEKNPTCKTNLGQGDGRLQYSPDEGIFQASTRDDSQSSSSYWNSIENSSRQVGKNQECLEGREKASSSAPGYSIFPFWMVVLERSAIINRCTTPSRSLSARVSSNIRSIYPWMTEIALARKKTHLNLVQSARERTNMKDSDSGFLSAETMMTPDNSTIGIFASRDEHVRPLVLPSYEAARVLESSRTKYFEDEGIILHQQNIEATDGSIVASINDADHQESDLAFVSHDCQNGTDRSAEVLDDNQQGNRITLIEAESSEIEINLPKEKTQNALVKQGHAFAGAMAGIFVSLCLHPIDTIKTVIQSRHPDQKPIQNIVRTIIVEKRIPGLYRGISSNVLCSAPISAVYTLTYESVKKSLLPLFPKEYQSLVHCTAGGCASVATSFIFTPSERIKQQMQVRGHYQSCWNALLQVLQKGGLSSLYTGWAAVLCRNVPHSIIKFYTYESLKQIIIPSSQSNVQANTSITLVCGGLAGSTASLFTTPFDVVKTRLQTQIPGSTNRYSSVFHALTEIGKHEGLRGLYRGLTPRLVMYMIQGALFFASYESFKKLLSLELEAPHTFPHEQKKEEDSKMEISRVAVTA